MNRRPPIAALVTLLCLASYFPKNVLAERGQFDKSPVIEAEENYIFTPPGFSQPGKPVKAEGADTAELVVTISDAATGKPTFCRVNVVGPDGNFYEPAENPLAEYSLTGTWPERLAGNRPSKAPIRYFGHFFYTPGKFKVRVPAGKSRVEVWKGFEYRPVTKEVELAAGASSELAIAIENPAPMHERGWHSGDPHLHFIRAGDDDDREIFDLLEAEDIRMGMILAYNETNDYPGLMPELITPQLQGLGKKSIRTRGGYQIISGQEYRNVVFGHVLLIGRKDLVLDGQHIDPNLGQVFGELGLETRREGGQSFYAHGGYAQEIWADIVQGAVDGVELLQFGIYRGIGLDGWYHVLNCGYRFPGVGACDYPACRKLGDARTYVNIDGPADIEKWLAGAAAGRSFMTTGPMILLDVDGNTPGDEIAVTGVDIKRLPVTIKVQSETCPVTHLQLVVNGKVERELVVEPTQSKELVLEHELNISGPAWIAARAFSKSPSGNADAEAHTNPVYVTWDGRKPFSAQSADYLLARLDEQIADHKARDVPEKSKAVEYFERSRAILLEAKARGGLAAAGQGGTADAVVIKQRTNDEELAEFLKPVPAKTPEEAVKTFEVAAGFRMELVAHEPDVTDPVAACFDENGGMYVAEMIDYPYRPQAGSPLGRVRYLVDEDNDGRYEQSSIFADEIAWPTGVAPYKGGVFVAAAPDIWYLRDTDGDRVADGRRKVFTGFGDRNQQGGINNLVWGIDHKIYGAGSVNGGNVKRVAAPDEPAIELSGRDFRFDPTTEKFETITGRQQFGNAFDNWFNRFVCSESNPLVHEVLPQEYVSRNPYLAVSEGMNDLAPGVTPIFRISPVERWRQIRSTRRLAAGERGIDSAGLSQNVIDAAAGLAVYRGHAYPENYQGEVFVGCSQNNLIHHRRLIPDGVTFRSERVETDTEFVRSTDTWFRPVNCINAPDGTLYVLDMSREVIESIHISSDVVKHLDLTNGRDKGRIYRLAPAGFQSPRQPRLARATSQELVELLEHPGGWWRDTATRLLFERQDQSVVPILARRLRESNSDVGRLHLMGTLAGLDALTDEVLLVVLADRSARVREHAVRLAATRVSGSHELRDAVQKLAGDDDPRVRFQVVFLLGEWKDAEASRGLAEIAARDLADPWLRTAVLSSCWERSGELLAALLAQSGWRELPQAATWCVELATIAGAHNDRAEVEKTLALARAAAESNRGVASALVLGLGRGLARADSSLSAVQSNVDSPTSAYLKQIKDECLAQIAQAEAPLGDQLAAVSLLNCFDDEPVTDAVLQLIDSEQPESLQSAALALLGRRTRSEIAERLIAVWPASSPKLQEQIITVLTGRPAWAGELLAACRDGQIVPAQVSGSQRSALLGHADLAIRQLAEELFASNEERSAAIARYTAEMPKDASGQRGALVFEQRCATCHRLGDRGAVVGPNLALVRNRTPQALLEAILDPNREVQPGFVNYVALDDAGRTVTGILSADSPTSITLTRDKGETETLLKQNLEALRSTGKSLMPEGLEKDISPAQMADLLSFLTEMQYDIGTRPDFVSPED